MIIVRNASRNCILDFTEGNVEVELGGIVIEVKDKVTKERSQRLKGEWTFSLRLRTRVPSQGW